MVRIFFITSLSQHHNIASITSHPIAFQSTAWHRITFPPSFHVGITPVLDMTGNSFALGALVLVPIAIAISAAFIALKTSHLSHKVAAFCQETWDDWYPWSTTRQSRRRRKLRRSNLPSTQVYGDSWCDLRSIDSREELDTQVKQLPTRRNSVSEGFQQDSLRRVWHPSRSTRLNWGFTNPRSLSPSPFESSNVAKPSPVAQPRGIRSVGDTEDHLGRLFAPRQVRQWQRTDP